MSRTGRRQFLQRLGASAVVLPQLRSLSPGAASSQGGTGAGGPFDLLISGGRVIDANGIAIIAAAGNQDSPVIAFNRRFLVLWVDRRRDPDGDVYATRLHDGVAQDGTGFVVAGSGAGEAEPSVSAGPKDGFGGVYQRYVAGAAYNATRAFLRTVTPK